MACYKLYGLTLKVNRTLSDLTPIPETINCDVTADYAGSEQLSNIPTVGVYRSPADIPIHDHTQRWFGAWAEPGNDGPSYHIRFSGRGIVDFQINATATQIRVTWPTPHIPLPYIDAFLIGPVMACALRIRNTLSLHACAVHIGDVAIAIAGNKGVGKSTTTAAFIQSGHTLIADDIVALVGTDGLFQVQPGPTRLRLWPSAINHLFGTHDHLPRVFEESEKRYVEVPTQQRPVQLAAVYILDAFEPTETVVIKSLQPTEGLVALLPHISASFLPLDASRRKDDFKVLGQLTATIPLRRIRRPACLEYVPQICDAILSDLDYIRQSTPIPVT